ncbi:MAG: LUD domain-containing protein [Bacteroidetes bacterium]|nr:LUD domain-containing protein [Bacteroidota bacterium]
MMEESTQREKILKKVRNALIRKTNNPFPDLDFESDIYKEINDSLEVVFAEEFIKVAGKFVYCESEKEFAESLKILMCENNWINVFCIEEKIKQILTDGQIPFLFENDDMKDVEVGITFCEYLIARLGSIMVSSKQECGRRMFVYPPVHIVVAYISQLVPNLKQALDGIKQKYGNKMPSMISVITGPSRTADIEKTLVMGAHGPKEIYVFLIDDTLYE